MGPLVKCTHSMKEEWCPQNNRHPVQCSSHHPHASGSPRTWHVTHAHKATPPSSNKCLFQEPTMSHPGTVPALTELTAQQRRQIQLSSTRTVDSQHAGGAAGRRWNLLKVQEGVPEEVQSKLLQGGKEKLAR